MYGIVNKSIEETKGMIEEQIEKLERKLRKNEFDFNDFYEQLEQIKKMGNIKDLVNMIPGVNKNALKNTEINENGFLKVQCIIQSMTPLERTKPEIINVSRKKRIAAGSGTTINDINRLAKQQMQMQTVMKRMKKMGMGGMMQQMKSLMNMSHL
jgi:signal recognition particle subunit SRP54